MNPDAARRSSGGCNGCIILPIPIGCAFAAMVVFVGGIVMYIV